MERDCVVMTSDMRVKTKNSSSYFYPDVVVVCGKPRFEDDTFDTLLNPIVIVGVLSPSTETYDRVDKFAHYQQLESLQEYILVSQDTVRVEHYIRQETQWESSEFRSLENVLSLISIECELALQDIYRRVEFREDHL
jgi:Uma2 family endonuclease